MKTTFKIGIIFVSVLLLMISFSTFDRTLSQTNLAAETQAIKIDGSSTVYPISLEATKRYQRQDRNAQMTTEFSGSGGGFRKFCAGETDLNNASRPINSAEIADCAATGIEYIEVPIAYDALTIVVHPDNDWVDSITVEELKKLWSPEAEGQITQWNQIRANWPNRPIKLFGPGQDSGTFDYFTEVIVGQPGVSRTDFTDSEDDDELVEGVRNDPEALGYFGIGYYVQNWEELKAVAVDSGEGPVYPTVDALRSVRYKPLSRPLFLYINAESLENKPTLQSFVEYYLQDVKNWVPFVGYIPLSDRAYALSLERFQQRKMGSLYQGQLQPDIALEEAL
ncbi:MAG: PstS family phosphate ABC transporter substrate-binding protein [Pleurocapsa sp.]